MLLSERVETPFEADFLARAERPASVGRRAVADRRQPSVSLSVHDDLTAIGGEWRRFEATADGTVFQTFDWLSAWQRNIGALHNVTPAIVVGRDAAGEIVLLLPLAIERRGPLRTLTFLGSELCDYNGPLLAADFTRRAGTGDFSGLWADIGRLLRGDRRFRHDAVVLKKLPQLVGDQPNPLLALATTLHPSGAYIAELGKDWDVFYAAKRSSAWRKRDRWKRKRLGDHGEMSLVVTADAENTTKTLTTLFEQKGRAFARMGVPNLFARPGHAAFYLDLATRPEMQRAVHVSALTVAGKPVAANFGVIRGDRFFHILVSYDDGELSRFGPGAVHLQEIMRDAVKRGCQLFDFTIGDEDYKREWSDLSLTLHDHRDATTVLGLAVVLPAVAGARVKRLVKQTPFLWRAAVKARALAASVTRRNRKAGAESESDQT